MTSKKLDTINRIKMILSGGEGSGNFGHAGRPGEVGGSAKEGQIKITTPKRFEPFNDKEYTQELRNYYTDWAENLSEEERYTLLEYTKGGYENINNSLRDDKLNRLTQMQVNIIDTTIEKSPKLQKDTTLYRGLVSEDLVKQLDNGEIEIGDSLKDLGYSSTTPNFYAAKQFTGSKETGVLLEINAKANSKGAYLIPQTGEYDPVKMKIKEDPLAVSATRHEYEFLLPRGTQFEVTGIRKDTDISMYKGEAVYVIEVQYE